MTESEVISNEQIQPWIDKLTVVCRTTFNIQDDDQHDLVQEALRMVISRKMINKQVSGKQARYLLLDAYERINKAWAEDRTTVSEFMHEIAVPPNQFEDMRVKNKILSPEEEAFEEELRKERRKDLSMKREIESRYFQDSLPLSIDDIWNLLG